MDFFAVPTATFRVLTVWFLIHHGRRKIVHFNITQHPTKGIGGWSDAEIGRAITHGIARDGHALKPPMAFGFYAGLKDADLKDIIAYLHTVPPLAD